MAQLSPWRAAVRGQALAPSPAQVLCQGQAFAFRRGLVPRTAELEEGPEAGGKFPCCLPSSVPASLKRHCTGAEEALGDHNPPQLPPSTPRKGTPPLCWRLGKHRAQQGQPLPWHQAPCLPLPSPGPVVLAGLAGAGDCEAHLGRELPWKLIPFFFGHRRTLQQAEVGSSAGGGRITDLGKRKRSLRGDSCPAASSLLRA